MELPSPEESVSDDEFLSSCAFFSATAGVCGETSEPELESESESESSELELDSSADSSAAG